MNLFSCQQALCYADNTMDGCYYKVKQKKHHHILKSVDFQTSAVLYFTYNFSLFILLQLTVMLTELMLA